MKIYSLVAAALIVGCVIIVPIFVFAIANYEATPRGEFPQSPTRSPIRRRRRRRGANLSLLRPRRRG